MKNWKKIVSMLIVSSVAVGACASCGNTSGSNSGKVRVVVDHWPSTEGTELDTLTGYKEGFEKENPNVEIVPDTWKFDLKSFYPKAEAGMLPNVCLVTITEIDKLIDGGYALDLTDELKEYGFYDKMNESIRELVSKDGRVYAVPNEAYAFGITYNVEMFKKAGLVEADGTPKQPKTWEELAEFAVKIKEATGKPGFVMCTTDNCGGWMLTNIAWSYGVDFMEQAEDGTWKATFNTDEMVQALQYVKDLRWKYDVLPANILIGWEEELKTFAVGDAAMALCAPERAVFAKYEMKPEQYGMLGIPAGPAKRVTLVGGNLRVLSNKTNPEQVDAAFKWIDYSGNGCRFDDVAKEALEKNIKAEIENGTAIGIKGLSVWTEGSEKVAYQNKLIDDNINMDPNSVKYYNESLIDGSIELQPEEPVCAQDLYGLLDNCIQKVLNDKDADCKEIIERANEEFQVNYLNNVDY